MWIQPHIHKTSMVVHSLNWWIIFWDVMRLKSHGHIAIRCCTSRWSFECMTVAHDTLSYGCHLWNVASCKHISEGESQVWWTGMLRAQNLNESWPSGTLCSKFMSHWWPPDCAGFLLRPFASFPWRQRTWWHRHERQTERGGGNGAENRWEIKWIDKVGPLERKKQKKNKKKTGKWIDCDRRERGWWRVWGCGEKSDAIDTLKQQRRERKVALHFFSTTQSAIGRHILKWQHSHHIKTRRLYFISTGMNKKKGHAQKTKWMKSIKGESKWGRPW